jgi:uncharacterized protein YigA (DUF484 family)
MNTPVQVEEQADIQASEVVAYLRRHPDFFVEQDELLGELHIPHRSGKAISLVERQLNLFREQRDHYQQQLLDLIATARQNDRFFDKSKRLLMNLVEAQSLDEVVIVLQDSFLEDFSVDFCSLLLFGSGERFPLTNVSLLSEEASRRVLGDMPDHHKAICGKLSPEKADLLFHKNAREVASAAVIPLRNGEVLGMLSIGSRRTDYFESSMGSLFLSYISDFLGRILAILMAKEERLKGMSPQA